MELLPIRSSVAPPSDSDIIIEPNPMYSMQHDTNSTTPTHSSRIGGMSDSAHMTFVSAAHSVISPAAETKWEYVKRNVPALISLVSVILNVIILSALIPSLRNDVTFMQGQSSAIQHQVDQMQGALYSINDKINGADTTITLFNSQLSGITQSINMTRLELHFNQMPKQISLHSLHLHSHNCNNRPTPSSTHPPLL